MKILHVITGMRKAAGTSVFCGEVCNGLVELGHNVTIAVINPNAADCYSIDSNIAIIPISSLLQLNIDSARLKFDVIHIHALWSLPLHRVAMWARAANIPLVWSPHGMLTPWAMHNKWWKKYLAWWFYQRRDLAIADLLHVTAENEVDDIARMGLRNKLIVAPLGVKVGGCAECAARAEGGRTLLFVSRVQRKKGLSNLVKAWAMLPKELRFGWRVRIVGPDQEGHTAEIRAVCERLGIASDWTFVGPKYGDDLRREYAGADLFVLPTFSENFGSVVIEALSENIPVITTKGTPWAEIEKRHCGWWIDIGVEPLSTALREAMSLDDTQRREMGERGRKLVEEKYTWDAIVKVMVKGYECIV